MVMKSEQDCELQNTDIAGPQDGGDDNKARFALNFLVRIYRIFSYFSNSHVLFHM